MPLAPIAPFAHTLQTFKTPSGASGRFHSLPALAATSSRRSPGCRCRSASCWRRCCAIATAAASRPSTCASWPTVGPTGERSEGDPVRGGARGAAGFHRRAAAVRPGRDAHRGGAPEQESEDDRAAGAGGPRGRPQRDDRRLRPQELARHQHEDRVPAQQRALQVHEVGHAGVRHLRRRAAGLRHRPPGQPRVPGARRAQAGQPPTASRRSTTPTRWWAPTATPR